MNTTFSLENSRVLVTGGLGFIGSHLVRKLLASGNEVLILDNDSTGDIKNLGVDINSHKLKVELGSILDKTLVTSLFDKVDFCFHLAASVGVKKIIENPKECVDINVNGSEVVLSAAAENNCPTLIASTSEIYGKVGGESISEESDRVLGATQNIRWVYSESKALEEMLAFQNRMTHNLPIFIARLFNTVGPGQKSDYGMVIPNFVKSAIINEPIKVYGDGSQVRAFCHVQDAIEGILGIAMEEKCEGEIFNLGSTEEVSILQLAMLVKKLAKSNSRIEHVPYSDAYSKGFEEIPRRVANIDKLRNRIEWEPKLSLEEIIHQTIDYWTEINSVDGSLRQ